MESLEFDSPTGINWNGTTGKVQYGAGNLCRCEFAMRPKYKKDESVKAGRPIYEDTEMVKFFLAGKDETGWVAVTDEHRKKYREQYANFKEGASQVIGTRLDLWPLISPAQAEELKALKVYTVEQAAELPDSSDHAYGMGIRTLKQKAKDWLAATKDTGAITKLESKNDDLEKQIRALQNTIQDLVDRGLAPSVKKKGRSKKVVDESPNDASAGS